MSVLVVDVGTTGLRAAIVDDRLQIRHLEYRACPPSTPVPGLVEFDAAVMATTVLGAVGAAAAASDDAIDAVGITTQRASVVVWDRHTGEPVGPGIGWQDLRTVGDCLVANAEHGWSLAPNQAATKLAWILANTPDLDPAEVCAGTVDSWIAWTLSEGALHISDQTNSSATMSGLRAVDGSDWNDEMLDGLAIPRSVLPAVVDSAGPVGAATAVPGAPPISAVLGDQQASLVGQGCVRPGHTKVTFGSGAMLDLVSDSPATGARRNPGGTYPLVLWSIDGHLSWGVEGIMLSAGTNVEWLRDDLGIIDEPAESHDVASRCKDTDGVTYVPALLGMGTPQWDYGARGALLGVTRGTGREHLVRAVLEGVAQRGADLLDAAIADTRTGVDSLRIDGGMSRNPTFVQALADSTGLPIEVSPVVEATTLGAGFMAGLGIDRYGRLDDIEALWQPSHVVHPRPEIDRVELRRRWADAVDRAREWHPELSALDV